MYIPISIFLTSFRISGPTSRHTYLVQVSKIVYEYENVCTRMKMMYCCCASYIIRVYRVQSQALYLALPPAVYSNFSSDVTAATATFVSGRDWLCNGCDFGRCDKKQNNRCSRVRNTKYCCCVNHTAAVQHTAPYALHCVPRRYVQSCPAVLDSTACFSYHNSYISHYVAKIWPWFYEVSTKICSTKQKTIATTNQWSQLASKSDCQSQRVQPRLLSHASISTRPCHITMPPTSCLCHPARLRPTMYVRNLIRVCRAQYYCCTQLGIQSGLRGPAARPTHSLAALTLHLLRDRTTKYFVRVRECNSQHRQQNKKSTHQPRTNHNQNPVHARTRRVRVPSTAVKNCVNQSICNQSAPHQTQTPQNKLKVHTSASCHVYEPGGIYKYNV